MTFLSCEKDAQMGVRKAHRIRAAASSGHVRIQCVAFGSLLAVVVSLGKSAKVGKGGVWNGSSILSLCCESVSEELSAANPKYFPTLLPFAV